MAFAEAGAAVVTAARTASEIKEVSQRAHSLCGVKTLALVCDVSEAESVLETVERTLRDFGKLDVVINCAGTIHPVGPCWQVDPEEWHANLKVNLLGAFHITRAVIPPLKDQGQGKIIHVSSGAAQYPVFGWTAYCAAKAGLDHFVRVAAEEASPLGVSVYGIWPGIVDTRMQEEIRKVSPELFGKENIQRFRLYHDRGLLRPPEDPVRLILYLAIHADLSMSGHIFNLDDPEVERMVDRALPVPVLQGNP
jgi:NAD(P)-dependent dehydrogenase (short-subunit alcohol dehydrogenase family)